MNDPSSRQPPVPARRPYGMVRLSAPVTVQQTVRRTGSTDPGRWYGPRVPLPPLSLKALRVDSSGH